MGKLNGIAIALIALLVGIVSAGIVMNYYHPETVTVTTDIHEYLDGEIIVNGTTFDWVEVEAGASYDWNYTIHNVGTITYNVSRVVYGLPGGWSETWTGNNTLLKPQEWLVGNLTLTIPADANGTYSWESWLIGKQT